MELWNTGVKVSTVNPGVIDTNIHPVTEQKVSRLQGSRFANVYTKYLQQQPQHGLPASRVADAIYDAIASPRPKYRYLLGSTREKLGLRIAHTVPDDIVHMLVAKRALSLEK
jgi:short-subunit dehydrogenase